jgi:hypothetical protein
VIWGNVSPIRSEYAVHTAVDHCPLRRPLNVLPACLLSRQCGRLFDSSTAIVQGRFKKPLF